MKINSQRKGLSDSGELSVVLFYLKDTHTVVMQLLRFLHLYTMIHDA